MTTGNTTAKKRIAIYGGSFNPPHEGHLNVLRHIHQALGADEIWMEFSENPFKDAADYVSLKDRFNMAALLWQSQPDLPLKFTAIGTQTGSNRTIDVLRHCKATHPDHELIWVMGSDSLNDLPQWTAAASLLEEFKIAVLKRDGSPLQPAEMLAAHERTADHFDDPATTGWTVLNVPTGPDISSSFYRAAFAKDPHIQTSAIFTPVANYIRDRGLYL